MAESFLFPIAETLIKKLSSRAYEEAFQAFNFSKDLAELKCTLSVVKGVLLDAEVKKNQSQALQEWLLQIKDIFSDAQNVLDEFDCHAKEKQVLHAHGSIKKKVCRFLSSSPLAFWFRMAHEIKEIRKRLDKVASDRHKFGLERIEVDGGVVHRREMTYSHVIASDVIGRDHDKENIIDLLFQTHPGVDASLGLSIVPIVGIGGMGKTTLAKLVFNDDRIDRQFPLKMWVCASDDFDIKHLMIKIINCLSVPPGGQENITNLDVEQLQNHLKNRLAHKKFLLVLDDVWNDDHLKWVKLQNLLQVGEGSRIIVTTQSKKIATMMGTVSLYELHGLSDEESLTVFIKWAFKEGEEKMYPNLVEIGKKIVRKCKGVPLTLTTLACSLHLNNDEEEWKSVRDNEIWNLEQKENDILLELKLSYDRMPSYLRQCFSFFSLYPKDFEFNSIDVIELWVALGLLHPPDESSKLEDVATQYLHELHSRCFLQDFMHFGYFYGFKMHNLMHDLAVYVTKNELFMVNSHTQAIPEKCHHLLIVENDHDQREKYTRHCEAFDRKSTRSLREFYFVDENTRILDNLPEYKCVKTIMFPIEGVGLGRKSHDLLNKWLSRYKYLWVLDLSDSSFEILPESIGKLRYLKYLNLSFNPNMVTLPNSICELQSLQTLLLKGCSNLQALPKGLGKLISLRQLAITTSQSNLSETDISSLTSLQSLSFLSCKELKSLLGGIQQLTSLKELRIHDCPYVFSLNFSIKHLPELVALSIIRSYNLKLPEDHDNLELTTRMKLRYVRLQDLGSLVSLPKWFQGAADTLHTLIIASCHRLEVLPDWLSTSSQLNTLRIRSCGSLSSLPNNMKGFTTLQCLEIIDFPQLEGQYRYQVGEYWPNISHLNSITIESYREYCGY